MPRVEQEPVKRTSKRAMQKFARKCEKSSITRTPSAKHHHHHRTYIQRLRDWMPPVSYCLLLSVQIEAEYSLAPASFTQMPPSSDFIHWVLPISITAYALTDGQSFACSVH